MGKAEVDPSIILVTADLQLGKRMSSAGDAATATVFREQLFLTAQRIITEIAPESDADLILVLGDTFDCDEADHDLIDRVAELFRSSQIPLHIIPGNHDPWRSGGALRTLAQRLEGVEHVVFHHLSEPHPLPDFGITLYPGILAQKFDLADKTAWIPERGADDGLRIGIFHGSIMDDPAGEERIRTISPLVAQEKDLDLVLLGDWHRPHDAPENRLHYAGAPEPQRFGHDFPGRILLVRIEDGELSEPEPVDVGRLTFIRLELELVSTNEGGDGIAPLVEVLEGVDSDPDMTAIRLHLSGDLDSDERDQLQTVLDEFKVNWPNADVRDRIQTLNLGEDLHPSALPVERYLREQANDDRVLERTLTLLRRYVRQEVADE